MGWDACKQGKVSDCAQGSYHKNDSCLTILKLQRSLHMASPRILFGNADKELQCYWVVCKAWNNHVEKIFI